MIDFDRLASLSLYDMLAGTAVEFPNHPAVYDGELKLTYRELLGQVDTFAALLHKKGFAKGDRAGLMLPNGVHYIISYYAVMRLGGTVVQVNPQYESHELEHILQDALPRWFFCHNDQEDKLGRLEAASGVEVMFTKDAEGKDQMLFNVSFQDTLPPQQVDPKEDVAVIQYTGGTTGRSKGAMLTHFNILANISQSGEVFAEVIEPGGERILGVAPLTHAMAMTNMNYTFKNASVYIILEKFNAGKVLELIGKYKPTYFLGSPTMYIALLNHPELEKYDLRSFKICLSGSAPLPVQVIRELEAKTGAAVFEGYGLSEGTTSTHRTPLGGLRKIGSVGIPIPYTESRIVDPEDGTTELPAGASGELILRGPQVMKGYLNMPEETADTIRGGWLYTGDIAMKDEDDFYYIVGRKKDMVIAGGLNIYPAEVEDVLYQHPSVAEACVFGVPDSYLGERLAAVVVPKEGTTFTPGELLNWCDGRIARYKIPREVEFRKELPKTIVGKVLRRRLVEEFANRPGD